MWFTIKGDYKKKWIKVLNIRFPLQILKAYVIYNLNTSWQKIIDRKE